ncbi:MAG TPA: transposase, partial [Desulfobacterales bacterium]|nr:transposase [Desulfobacterales bacterium]
FQVNDKNVWPQIRTTNAIERRFREVRRRTRPMGVFSDKTSMERILYAVFSYENLRQGVATPFSCGDTKLLTLPVKTNSIAWYRDTWFL